MTPDGKLPVGAEVLDRVGARRRERGSHDLEARPRNDALVDGVAHGDVVVAGALGLEVPHRGEAVLEADLACARTARATRWAGYSLRICSSYSAAVGVALEEDVRVGVDQAGQEHAVAEVDDASRRPGRPCRRSRSGPRRRRRRGARRSGRTSRRAGGAALTATGGFGGRGSAADAERSPTGCRRAARMSPFFTLPPSVCRKPIAGGEKNFALP